VADSSASSAPADTLTLIVAAGMVVGPAGAVPVAVGVFVRVAVAVPVEMGVPVRVAVAVSVATGVAVRVAVAVPVEMGVPVRVAVGEVAALGVAVGCCDAEPYSMCSRGAAGGRPSHASAVRLPEPVTISASELPLAQPGLSTISWMTADRSGVRCPGPACPAVVQGEGTQPTAADVLGLSEILRVVAANVGALSLSCPAMVREAASVVASSAVNCM
jgi:hypothetical protein